MRSKQQTLAASGFERYRKRTRREQFLADMNRVVPWGPLVDLIAPVYPKGEGAGRPPVGLERMLRIHCLQHWFNLSDPAVEEALYDSRAMREFVGIDLGREPVPDETTICKFRHLLEAHELGRRSSPRSTPTCRAKGFKVGNGHDRGCDDHQRAELDQEPRRRARSGDAPDQEGQRVALRHEGAHRCRQPD
jgi:transposase, IS5 family